MNIEHVIGRLLSLSGLPDPLPADPMPTLLAWFAEARESAAYPDPNAMTLATVDSNGRPAARIVLCRNLEPAGSVVFYTNYTSPKGRALEATGRAAIVFHWHAQGRQARGEGAVARVSTDESDRYFASRDLLKRIGAWASDQSSPLSSRAELLTRMSDAAKRFGVSPAALLAGDDVHIPRPPHWGGFRITLDRVELWVGGTGRLHDRAAWTRSTGEPWRGTRLQP